MNSWFSPRLFVSSFYNASFLCVMDDKETYLVRFPCRDSILFKLFLYEDGDQNSHTELFNRYSGNIYCNKAGLRRWHGGERTDPGGVKRMENT